MNDLKHRGYTIRTTRTEQWLALISPPGSRQVMTKQGTATIQEGEARATQRAKSLIDAIESSKIRPPLFRRAAVVTSSHKSYRTIAISIASGVDAVFSFLPTGRTGI